MEVERGKGKGGVGREGQGGFGDIERQYLPMVYEAAVAKLLQLLLLLLLPLRGLHIGKLASEQTQI